MTREIIELEIGFESSFCPPCEIYLCNAMTLRGRTVNTTRYLLFQWL